MLGESAPGSSVASAFLRVACLFVSILRGVSPDGRSAPYGKLKLVSRVEFHRNTVAEIDIEFVGSSVVGRSEFYDRSVSGEFVMGRRRAECHSLLAGAAVVSAN